MAAVEAVRQWRYSPTLLNGSPVPVIAEVRVNFTMSKAGTAAPKLEETPSETGVIQRPAVLSSPKPDYTKEAREAKVEGIVLLSITVKKDGTVGNVELLQGLGYGLDEAAIYTVMSDWRFSPATLDGEPVDQPATVGISFKLIE